MKSLIITCLWLACLHCHSLSAQENNLRPLMKDFIGINTRSSDDIRFIEKFDFVREYHEWSDDTGFDLDGVANCPQNLLSFSPSNSQAATIDLDEFYSRLSGRVAPVMKWLAPEMRGLQSYNPSIQEQKPLCGNLSALDQENPTSYYDYAKWVSILVARYGETDVCSDPKNEPCRLLNEAVIDKDIVGASIAGLGHLRYLELGNEPDKWWYDNTFRNTPNALWQMMPQQYAALLHAAYDGAGKSQTFSLPPSNSTFLGIKNIDSRIKVAMGGLSDFRGRYIIEMLEKAYALRASNPNAVKKIPFDILNIHHYTSNNPNNGTAYIDNNALWNTYDYYGLNPGGQGVSPEQCQLKKRYERFLERLFSSITSTAIKNELAQMDFWLSEFGYDTNNNSEIKAKLAQNSQSYFHTQAQWLVRSWLELSAVEYTYLGKKIVLDKAVAYDLRDGAPSAENAQYSGGGWLFSHSGLLTRDFKPKRSWYYTQTLKKVLGETKFTKDMNVSGDIAFDNGGIAPRIYYYKGMEDTRILVIWSPTSANVSDKNLRLSVQQIIAKIGEPELHDITAYTVVQMRDNSEAGFRQGFDVANGELTLNASTVPISETPVFVLLNQKTSDTPVQCPIIGTPVATGFCNGALLEWETNAATDGHWNVFFAQKNNLPAVANCQDYQNTDLLGNGFVRTYLHDLPAGQKRLLIEGLKPNTAYVAFMVYIHPNGIAAQKPCVVCFSTNNNLPPVVNPCLTVQPAGSCNSTNEDYCKLVVENTGAALNAHCPGNCASGNPQMAINCNTYSTGGCGAPNLYAESQLWSSCNNPKVTVTFENALRLDALKLYHHSGLSHIKIYYSTCDDPGEQKYLSTIRPMGCNQWYSVLTNLPGEPVKKLHFYKVAARGKAEPAKVSIGKLHFYGKELADCGNMQIQKRGEHNLIPAGIRVLPNPASEKIKASWSQSGYERLLLYDSSGTLLRQHALDGTEDAFVCDVGGLPTGTYCIRLIGTQLPPQQQMFILSAQ